MIKKYIETFVIVMITLLSMICFPINVSADVINEKNQTQTSLIEIKEKQLSEKEDYEEKYAKIEASGTVAYVMHKIIVYNIIIIILIVITCIISLVLNCMRKNIGKAVFSGISIFIPIISNFLLMYESTVYTINGKMTNLIIFFVTFILEILVGILSIIFCFSKSKK